MVTKALHFAMDEKGLKVLAPTLIGQTISYWDDHRTLKQGVVRSADVVRDRYGSPFVEAELDEVASPASAASG